MRQEHSHSVVTYESSSGARVNMTRAQETAAQGRWPRDQFGEELATVYHGRHRGTARDVTMADGVIVAPNGETVRAVAGYIATDDDGMAIYGVGETAETAIADARRDANAPEAEFLTIPATRRLLAAVERDGGAPGAQQWAAYAFGEECRLGHHAAVADLMDD